MEGWRANEASLRSVAILRDAAGMKKVKVCYKGDADREEATELRDWRGRGEERKRRR